MAFRLNALARNATLNALASGVSVLEIYTGTQPAAGGTATGTKLGTITAIGWGAATGGTKLATSSTQDSSADASGTAGWGRFRTTGGTKFFDGSVGSQFTLSTAVIVAGGTISLTSATLTQPAS